MELKEIAKIHTDFPGKFGIPRQSGLASSLESTIIFAPEYRNPDAIRGIESASHLWLIWGFSEVKQEKWSPMVRPPRLGGNKRLGVFATRSPYRPNPIGLSAVRLQGVTIDPKLGPILHLSGADLMDGTPIYDIKPYIPYTDSKPEATSGIFSKPDRIYKVIYPDGELGKVTKDKQKALTEVLAQNPAPAYQHDANKVYSFEFANYHIEFSVNGDQIEVKKIE
jgi:tRNA-Thr(GGU) m(6)t(6)A37 methyltransferase TsaA